MECASCAEPIKENQKKLKCRTCSRVMHDNGFCVDPEEPTCCPCLEGGVELEGL